MKALAANDRLGQQLWFRELRLPWSFREVLCLARLGNVAARHRAQYESMWGGANMIYRYPSAPLSEFWVDLQKQILEAPDQASMILAEWRGEDWWSNDIIDRVWLPSMDAVIKCCSGTNDAIWASVDSSPKRPARRDLIRLISGVCTTDERQRIETLFISRETSLGNTVDEFGLIYECVCEVVN